MAIKELLLITALLVIVCCEYNNEIKTENKAKTALETEKEEQKTRSANPSKEKGSFQKLQKSMINKTNENKGRRRGKGILTKIRQLNNKHKNQTDHNFTQMLNDNEGFEINHKDNNDTITLNDKIKVLRQEGPNYVPNNNYNTNPQINGVFCNFEPNNGSEDTCKWEWNTTVSSHGLGFQRISAADLYRMNQSTRGLKFSGPSEDADGDPEGQYFE